MLVPKSYASRSELHTDYRQGAFFRTFLALFDAGVTRQKWYLNLEWRKRLAAAMMDLYFQVYLYLPFTSRHPKRKTNRPQPHTLLPTPQPFCS